MLGTSERWDDAAALDVVTPNLQILPDAPSAAAARTKRVLDIVAALTLLVVTALVLLVAALVVKAQDGGPVLFRQVRIGRNGKPFTMYKLRSMVVDAESRIGEVARLNRRTGPLFKAPTDPRITRFGRFMRSSCIDELPQLFNVLRGDMSMVGPRPALPSEVAQFGRHLLVRHVVRPGITGLWQVSGREHADFTLYEKLDLQYVMSWNLRSDLRILAVTVVRVLQGTMSAIRPSRRQARRLDVDLCCD